MSILFLDTETTGFVQKGADLLDPRQPYCLELGARLDDDEGNMVGELDLLLNYGDISISEGAYNVHHISADMIKTFGVPPIVAFGAFNALAKQADLLVGHNIAYDMDICKIGFARLSQLDSFTQNIQSVRTFCTMQATTNICKIPKPGGGAGYKWPKLDEAYSILIDSAGFENAHRAKYDMLASREIFYSLKKAPVPA